MRWIMRRLEKEVPLITEREKQRKRKRKNERERERKRNKEREKERGIVFLKEWDE